MIQDLTPGVADDKNPEYKKKVVFGISTVIDLIESKGQSIGDPLADNDIKIMKELKNSLIEKYGTKNDDK